MHDELTKKDIEKMEAEIEHRKLVVEAGDLDGKVRIHIWKRKQSLSGWTGS